MRKTMWSYCILVILLPLMVSCGKVTEQGNTANNPSMTIEHISDIAESEKVNTDEAFVHPEAFKYFDEGQVNLEESFPVEVYGLQVTINQVSLNRNVYEAGWTIHDIDPESMVILNNVNHEMPINYLCSNIDLETGNLAEGLTLVTVEITVKNSNIEDTSFGPNENTFPCDVLYLVAAREQMGETDGQIRMEIPAYKSVACSAEQVLPGQNAWIQLLPGEEASYRLAYISDEYVTIKDGYISTYYLPIDGMYCFPLAGLPIR